MVRGAGGHARLRLSVVVPCFNEGVDHRRHGRAAAGACCPGLAGEFEVVFCNDGSTDDTGERLKALAARDPRIRAEGLHRQPRRRTRLPDGAGSAHRAGSSSTWTRISAMDPADGRAGLHRRAGKRRPGVLLALRRGTAPTTRSTAGCRASPTGRSTAACWACRSTMPCRASSGCGGKCWAASHRCAMDGFEVYLELLVKARQAGLRIA